MCLNGGCGFNLLQANSCFHKGGGGVKLDIVSKVAELRGFRGREGRQFDPEVDSRREWTFDPFLNHL